MLFSLVAFVSTSMATTEVLLVDGAVLAALTPEGWQSYRAVQPLPAMALSEVRIGTSGPAAINARFKALEGGLIGITEERLTPGVFFSTKAWFPRSVDEITSKRANYLNLVRQAARKKTDDPRAYILNVWSVDLDGSGSQEEIVEAVSRPQVLQGKNDGKDWSATFLRWQDKGCERFYPLNWSFPRGRQPVDLCRIRAVADFDGEGEMKIVSTSTGDLRWSATLWALQEGKLIPLVDINANRIAMKFPKLVDWPFENGQSAASAN